MEDTASLSLVKDFGFAAIAFILVYVMLKQEQMRSHEKYKELVDFSSKIVSLNTAALTHMNDGLNEHMNQKDKLIERMKDCAASRDERFRRIETQLVDIKKDMPGR